MIAARYVFLDGVEPGAINLSALCRTAGLQQPSIAKKLTPAIAERKAAEALLPTGMVNASELDQYGIPTRWTDMPVSGSGDGDAARDGQLR